MYRLLLMITVLVILAAGYLMIKASASKNMDAPLVSDGVLPACPDKPNCVLSTVDTNDAHYIEALPASGRTPDELKTMLSADGARSVVIDENVLYATYHSKFFGFIDDLILIQHDDRIDVRSSSRVGHSDFAANRNRVERLRNLLLR